MERIALTTAPPQPRYRRRKLTTLRQYRAFINRILWEMEEGKRPISAGTRLIWSARQGADLTRELQELEELRLLRLKLDQLQNSTTTYVPYTDAELLPAPRNAS